MNKNYMNLIKGIDLMSESLIAIGNDGSSDPIKLIVARIVDKLGFNNQEIGDDIAMLRFAVANDDPTLVKLTASMMGDVANEPEVSDAANEPVS